MLGVAMPQVARGQTAARYRVTTNNAWFYQDVGGRRIAQLVRGAVLTAGRGNATRNDWVPVTLDGWIFATSVGRSGRPDFDLAVTRARHPHPIQTVWLRLPPRRGDWIRPALNRSA